MLNLPCLCRHLPTSFLSLPASRRLCSVAATTTLRSAASANLRLLCCLQPVRHRTVARAAAGRLATLLSLLLP